eukprot:scaffold4676_cov406-Pinguiococcus_pyrenoidosus.AAC.2
MVCPEESKHEVSSSAQSAASNTTPVRVEWYLNRCATPSTGQLTELGGNDRADAVLDLLSHARRKELLVKVQDHGPGFDVFRAESALLRCGDRPFWIFDGTDEVATNLSVAVAIDLELRASAAARQPLEGDAAASKGRNQI